MGGGGKGGSQPATEVIQVSPTGYTSFDEGKTYQADPNTHFTVNGTPYYVEAGKDANDRTNWLPDTMADWHSPYDPNQGADMAGWAGEAESYLSELQASLEAQQAQMESSLASIQAQADAYKKTIADAEEARKKRIGAAGLGRSTTITGGLGDTSEVNVTRKALLGE